MLSLLKRLSLFDTMSSVSKGIDYIFVIALVCLLSLGLIMVFSSSVAMNNPSLHQGANFRFFILQLAYLSVGIVAMIFVWMIPIDIWSNYSRHLLIISIVLLILVLIPGIGVEINASRRWIRLGSFNFQPSELVKVFMVIYMASYLCRKGEMVTSFVKGIMIPAAVVFVVCTLLLLEPDYGTTVVLVVTLCSMLFISGIRMSHTVVIIAVALILLGVLAFSQEYRIARLMTFTNPWLDPYAKGFQLTQALIAIGRGEWFGVGLGNSVQKLAYLPHAHNDFILAVIGEELGFFGIVLVISLYATIVWRIFVLAKQSESLGLYFGAKVCHGIAILIGFQALINIGVNLGVLPTKGLTLPFISYGGSSIVVSCIQIGIVLAIQTKVAKLKARAQNNETEVEPDEEHGTLSGNELMTKGEVDAKA